VEEEVRGERSFDAHIQSVQDRLTQRQRGVDPLNRDPA